MPTLLAVLLILSPALAFAADGKSAAAELMTYLIGLIASIVLVLVQHMVRKWLAPKVSKDTADLLDKLAEAGVRYAEEKGRAAIKTTGAKMASDEKLERASAWVLAEADRFGVKDMGLERVRKYVESALGKTRTEPEALPPVPCDTLGKVRGV